MNTTTLINWSKYPKYFNYDKNRIELKKLSKEQVIKLTNNSIADIINGEKYMKWLMFRKGLIILTMILEEHSEMFKLNNEQKEKWEGTIGRYFDTNIYSNMSFNILWYKYQNIFQYYPKMNGQYRDVSMIDWKDTKWNATTKQYE